MKGGACDLRWMVEWQAVWQTVPRTLRAFEPNDAELAAAAPTLAAFYNDSYNRTMMSNTIAFSAGDVVAHVSELQDRGERPFLLESDGALVGDADLRHMADGSAEFAILVGRRAEQGRGVGTRFAALLHAFAFGGLGLARIYVAIIPQNLPSQRLFARLGYEPDDSPLARRFADESTDLTFSVGRDAFERHFPDIVPYIRWSSR